MLFCWVANAKRCTCSYIYHFINDHNDWFYIYYYIIIVSISKNWVFSYATSESYLTDTDMHPNTNMPSSGHTTESMMPPGDITTTQEATSKVMLTSNSQDDTTMTTQTTTGKLAIN